MQHYIADSAQQEEKWGDRQTVPELQLGMKFPNPFTEDYFEWGFNTSRGLQETQPSQRRVDDL